MTLRQQYRFSGSVATEATFAFPLDPEAAVHALEVHMDGKVVKGCVREKQAARSEYRAAVSAGHGAVLVEESDASTDVFIAKCE